MKCKEMPEHLVSLLYGELETEEAKQVRSHLKTCPSCKEAFQELQSTSKLLQQWEDVSPDMNLVFVKESASHWSAVKERISDLGWGKRLALGVPAVAVALLLIMSLINFKLEYTDGNWNMAFSLLPQKSTQTQFTQLAETYSDMQSETLNFVKQMIDESERRQQRESALTLAQFAVDWERRRQDDLRVLGQGLEGLHINTQARFNQTDEVINRVIHAAGLKVEK